MVQMANEVPEGSGADSKPALWKVLWHIGRKQTSFRAVLVQMADEVPEGSGLDGRRNFGWFRYRKQITFRRVPVQSFSKIFQAIGDNTWVYFPLRKEEWPSWAAKNQDRKAPIMQTSAKSHIGHLEANAGQAGIIKCSLAGLAVWTWPYITVDTVERRLLFWRRNGPTWATSRGLQ